MSDGEQEETLPAGWPAAQLLLCGLVPRFQSTAWGLVTSA